MIKKTCSNFW